MRSKLFRANFFAMLTMVLAILFSASSVVAQTSSFTYQGRLTDGGTAANGNYDLQFALFDSLSGGTQIGSTQTLNTVAVSNGVFTVSLDFGASSFTGANRFLEISARPSGAGSFTLLTPRQPVTATPYAVRSANASAADVLSSACSSCVQDAQINSVSGSKVSGTVASATNAANATNAATATNATQLGGIAASQYVQTSDSRLTDARPPTAGSVNYIQNSTSQQASTNFNISGNGTVGGTLSGGTVQANTVVGNIFNASTQFNIGGNRVLRASGAQSIDSLFVGVGAGVNQTVPGGNTIVGQNAGNSNVNGFLNVFVGNDSGKNNVSGFDNVFLGFSAGSANTTGADNTFVGSMAGSRNTEGGANAFFGASAGQQNVAGVFNAFFGPRAGGSNTTGGSNTIIGTSADLGSGNLTNATAIGAFSRVDASNALVLGGIKNINGAFADTNVGIGTTAPVFRLHVVDPGAAGLRVQTNTGGGAVASFGGFGDFQIDSNGLAGGRFIVQQAGRVGISTNAPTSTLSVNGTADKPGGGSWGTFSDERLKNIKGRFTPGLRAVMQLQPLRYEYKRDNALGIKSEGEHIGFSAQAVQRIIPEAVSKNEKGYLLVNNDPILWTMLNAIKEQQAQIEKLRTANAALNARLRAVERSSPRKRVSSRPKS